MRKGRVLFIANHRKNRSPGQRFRFEQYIDYLSQSGFECEISFLLSAKDDRFFYSTGNLIPKIVIYFKCLYKRFKDIKKAKNYDVIFIFREAFFTGTTFFERRVRRLPIKIIFDFDDSIWLPNVSPANKNLAWLKNYAKTSKIIKLSNLVITGNQYLANYAMQYNANVKIIPTTIDTSYHKQKKQKSKSDKICIGWTGTSTTLKHFEYILPVLIKIKEKYSNKVYFKMIGEEKYSNNTLAITSVKWDIATEIEDLSELDIGIMPLPNDEWAKGKCGFKGLQYMSLEIPAILSPVGVNAEIIQDGINGYLADTEEEWIRKISILIESEELREKLGKAGRQTVIEKYSVEANRQKYLDIFNDL